MRYTRMLFVSSLIVLTACTPLNLAPGAAQVRLTTVAAEVAGCSPVGNIRIAKDDPAVFDSPHAIALVQNQTIGFGGNVAFISEGSPRFPSAGIAYRCNTTGGTR